MKRIYALILAAMLALAALTGCADTGLYGADMTGNVSTTDNGRVNGGGYATDSVKPRRATRPHRTTGQARANNSTGTTGSAIR